MRNLFYAVLLSLVLSNSTYADIFENGGGGAIGDFVTGGTANSVLFIGPTGLLAKSTDLTFNSTTKILQASGVYLGKTESASWGGIYPAISLDGTFAAAMPGILYQASGASMIFNMPNTGSGFNYFFNIDATTSYKALGIKVASVGIWGADTTAVTFNDQQDSELLGFTSDVIGNTLIASFPGSGGFSTYTGNGAGTVKTLVSNLTGTAQTFYVPVVVPEVAYSSAWDGSASVTTRNAVYDKIETMVTIGKAIAIKSGMTGY